MSLLVLDTGTASTATWWDMIVQLEGLQYIFEFLWSDRETCWYLNISDQGDNALATGIKLTVSWPLLRHFVVNPALPQGTLFCQDMTGNSDDIASPEELGQRVLLMYITSDVPQ